MFRRYLPILVPIVLMMALACGSGTSSSPPEEEAKCGTLMTNQSCESMDKPDGFSDERHFILQVPETISNNPPLFISLHGSGGRADRVSLLYQFQTMVNDAGYIGAFPDAIIREDDVSTWNAHDSTYGIPFVDDVSYISNIIDTLRSSHNFDPARVLVLGWSNGGFMANLLACEIPDKISAIYTLAGNLRAELTDCSSNGNVAIQHLHPTGDQTVPFAGDSNRGYISAEEANGRWVTFNQCDNSTDTIGPFDLTRDVPSDDSNSYRYQNCQANVEFTIIDGSDHGPDFQIEKFHQELFEFFDRSVQ
jgi:polyhydroxybutyrate depolymerase